jgi:hypothetical protein
MNWNKSQVKFNKIDKSCYFDGQFGLLKAGLVLEYEDWMIEEIDKCRDDISYFCTKYLKVVDLDRGIVPFCLYDYQEEMMHIMDENRFSIFLTARQMGKTQVVAAYLLHAALFNSDIEIAILANKETQAREIMSRWQLMYTMLPLWMQPGIKGWNKGDVWLANGEKGTKVFCAATGGSSIRGRSINILYLDEFAFVQNDVEFYTSTYPTITAGSTTKVIITSTPKGLNQFYKIYHDAENGLGDYKHLRVTWEQHPRRDIEWKKTQLRNMTEKQFDQEFACKFLGSSDTLISGDKLQQLVYNHPMNNQNEEPFWTLYAEPIPGSSYVITVDVSEGIGKDYSIISVIDVTQRPFIQVAKYRNNTIVPLMLADVAFRIATLYNMGSLLVENNSIGQTVTNSLWFDYEYENLITTKIKNLETVNSDAGRTELGVRTTVKTKAIGTSILKTLIESDTLIIQDYDTIVELSTFIKHGNKYEAEKGKTDDIVMSLVIFAWFTTQPNFEEEVNVNMRNLLRQRLDAQDEQGMVCGFLNDGQDQDDFGSSLF